MKVLVTGANGLIGRALCGALERSGVELIRAVRVSSYKTEIAVGAVHELTNWGEVLDLGPEVVVHLAAKVPLSHEQDSSDAMGYEQVNSLGTANLARQCADRGVKRFVFVSTVKVLGEGQGEPYRSDSPAEPEGGYAISKWKAEQCLKQIAAETGMEVIILRPPLVYGPGVRGNFFRLMRSVYQGVPLPLGLVKNRRSLIYLGNLVDALQFCLTRADIAGVTLMVSDSEDVSTVELIRRMSVAFGRRKAWLLPVPVSLMKWMGRLLGRQDAVERLVGSLFVDISPIRELGWMPPCDLDAGLAATAQWFLESEGSV